MKSALLDLCKGLLNLPAAAAVVMVVSCATLAVALTAQYGFGHTPCVLCLWQRAPYAAAFVLALLSLLSQPYGRGQMLLFFALCLPLFLAGAGTAFFHTGVELHWWLGTDGCAIQPLHGEAASSLRERLLATPTARCDQISGTFLGLSMANWNIGASLALAAFTLIVIMRELRGKNAKTAPKP